jgi:hypothetical protein
MAATTAYVTAFVNVPGRDQNTRRRQPDAYKQASRELLQQDIFLYYFGDAEMADHVRTERTKHGLLHKTHIVPLTFEELPAYPYFAQIQANSALDTTNGWDKNRYTPAYFTTILSKLFLTTAVATDPSLNRIFTPSPTHFCWIDFGLFHLKESYPFSFRNMSPSVFTEIDQTAPTVGDRLRLQLISPLAATTLSLAEFCAHDRNLSNGALFGGSPAALAWTSDRAHEGLRILLAAGHLLNEEGLLAQIFQNHPERFSVTPCYYATTLPNFASIRCGPERIFLFLENFRARGWHQHITEICWKTLAGLQQGYINLTSADLRRVFDYYLESLVHQDPQQIPFVTMEAIHRGVRPTSDELPWVYTHGVDSLYGDIRQIPAPFTLADLYRNAIRTPGCIGFTSTGWLKHTLRTPLLAYAHSANSGVFALKPILQITEV